LCDEDSTGGFLNKISKKEINKQYGRATPHQWSNYVNAKMAITLTSLGKSGPRISDHLKARCYINDRKPGIGTFRIHLGSRLATNHW